MTNQQLKIRRVRYLAIEVAVGLACIATVVAIAKYGFLLDSGRIGRFSLLRARNAYTNCVRLAGTRVVANRSAL